MFFGERNEKARRGALLLAEAALALVAELPAIVEDDDEDEADGG